MRCCDLWGSHIFGFAMFLSNGWQIDDCWAVIGLPVCIFSHVTTKALPRLNCRGCTCESAVLCQYDSRFVLQEEKNKGERNDEEVMVSWEIHRKGYWSARRARQTWRKRKGKQVRSVMFLQSSVLTHLWKENPCVAFVARNVSSFSQNNPASCQINLSKDLLQSTQ